MTYIQPLHLRRPTPTPRQRSLILHRRNPTPKMHVDRHFPSPTLLPHLPQQPLDPTIVKLNLTRCVSPSCAGDVELDSLDPQDFAGEGRELVS